MPKTSKTSEASDESPVEAPRQFQAVLISESGSALALRGLLSEETLETFAHGVLREGINVTDENPGTGLVFMRPAVVRFAEVPAE